MTRCCAPGPGPALSRRRALALLAAGLAGAAAGCTAGDEPAPTQPTSTAPPAPDPLIAVLSARLSLLDRIDATTAAHPDLAGRLGPVRDQTAEHVTALQLALARPTASPSPSPPSVAGSATAPPPGGSSGPAAGPTDAPVVPGDPGVALAELRAAVAAAGTAATSLCTTVPAARAPLVGSLAAAAAGHDVVLG